MLTERRVTGGVLIALGAVAVLEARRLSVLREEMVAGAAVGDDTFPMIVGVALLALAAYVLAFAHWAPARVSFPGGPERGRLVRTGGLLVAYYLITPLIGYTGATLVVSIALFRTMGDYRWWVSLALGAVTTGALYLMFRVWLLQPLPTGWLGV